MKRCIFSTALFVVCACVASPCGAGNNYQQINSNYVANKGEKVNVEQNKYELVKHKYFNDFAKLSNSELYEIDFAKYGSEGYIAKRAFADYLELQATMNSNLAKIKTYEEQRLKHDFKSVVLVLGAVDGDLDKGRDANAGHKLATLVKNTAYPGKIKDISEQTGVVRFEMPSKKVLKTYHGVTPRQLAQDILKWSREKHAKYWSNAEFTRNRFNHDQLSQAKIYVKGEEEIVVTTRLDDWWIIGVSAYTSKGVLVEELEGKELVEIMEMGWLPKEFAW